MAFKSRQLTKEDIIQKGLAIDSEFCVMCGLCVAICPTGAITLDLSGIEPHLFFGNGCSGCGLCYQVCPGKVVPFKTLDHFVFGRDREPRGDVLGIYRACYQANATDVEIRASGASGGVVSALLTYALEKGRISAASVVAFDQEQPWKAIPRLATTRRGIIGAAKSKYTIVPINAALADPEAKKLPGYLGCVGLACHVHGLRKLQYYYPKHPLSKKIAFVIGVHCGGKGARPMGQNISILKEQLGVNSLDEIRSLSYREGKVPDECVAVVKKNGEVVQVRRGKWAAHPTMFGRCHLCWDFGAELSDVSVGDFFGPAASGSRVELGASTMLVRTQTGEQLVNEAVEAGYIKKFPTPVEPILHSVGLASKKYGSAFALMVLQKFGLPCPDYEYVIQPMKLRDKLSSFSGVPIQEREQLWAQWGIHALP